MPTNFLGLGSTGRIGTWTTVQIFGWLKLFSLGTDAAFLSASINSLSRVASLLCHKHK
jgi:hypothetical protein